MNIQFKGLKELINNLNKQPGVTINEIKTYLVKSEGLIQRTITKNPWRIGGSGGGMPKATGNLIVKGTDIEVNRFSVKFVVSDNTEYGKWVHDGTRRMEARPWLWHAKKENLSGIEDLQKNMLNKLARNIIK